MWFEILKQDGITHFHGTKNKGAAEKIMKEGIKPALGFEGYRKADRYYVARHPPVISEVEYQQQEEFEILPELNGAYVWAAKEAPLGYSGWYEKTHADDRNVVFTDKGPIIQGKPDLYEWQEGGLWGIKGKDIEWLEVYSVCYRMNIPHYVTKETIPPNKLVHLSIDDWEEWYDNHRPGVWADCEQEIRRGALTDSMLDQAQERRNWGPLNR